MPNKDGTVPLVNRRSVLQKSGTALVGSSLLASNATASLNEKRGHSDTKRTDDTQCKLCRPRILASSDEATLLRIPNVEINETAVQAGVKAAKATRKVRQSRARVDPEVANFNWKIPDYDDEFLIRINRENNIIDGKIVPTKQLDALDTSNISVSAHEMQLAGSNDVSTMERLDVYVQDYENWGEQFGDCGGYTADHHYAAGIAIHTGESWSRLTGAVLGGLLCAAVPGGWMAKLGGKFWGSGICAAIGSEIYNWVGPSTDNKFTYAMWDIHRGWGDIEHLVRGRANHWTTTHSDLTYTYSIPGVHIGQVLDTPDIIL